MAPLKNLTAICVSLGLLSGIGCVSDPSSDTDPTNADGSASGDDVTGSNPTGTTGGTTDTTTGGTSFTSAAPVYPTAHPRIYLTPNRARLVASLNAKTSAATRFKANVDAWAGGADIWGFEVWTAALLGQLTGNAAYCTKAVASVDAQVSAAEAVIATALVQ